MILRLKLQRFQEAYAILPHLLFQILEFEVYPLAGAISILTSVILTGAILFAKTAKK